MLPQRAPLSDKAPKTCLCAKTSGMFSKEELKGRYTCKNPTKKRNVRKMKQIKTVEHTATSVQGHGGRWVF